MSERDVSNSLGIQKMPEGYKLMLNADESHFYWERQDGAESCVDWNKWRVWRGAMKDAAAQQEVGDERNIQR